MQAVGNSGQVYCQKVITTTDQAEIDQIHRALTYYKAYLVHPNICQIYSWEYSQPTNSVTIQIEQTKRSLWDEIFLRSNEYGVLWNDSELCWHLRTIVSALSYAEQSQTYHQNLTPETIFVTDFGVKVGDFSHLANPRRPMSPHYIFQSPEFLTSSNYSITSDVYSLGVVLLSMFHLCVPTLDMIKQCTDGMENYPLLREIIWRMLLEDWKQRPNLAQIESLFEEIENRYLIQTGVDVQATIRSLHYSDSYDTSAIPQSLPNAHLLTVSVPPPPQALPSFSPPSGWTPLYPQGPASLPATLSSNVSYSSPSQFIPPPSGNMFYSQGLTSIPATGPVYCAPSFPQVIPPPSGNPYYSTGLGNLPSVQSYQGRQSQHPVMYPSQGTATSHYSSHRQRSRQPASTTRVCATCGIHFTPNPRYPRSFFCSKSCFNREKHSTYCIMCGAFVQNQSWVSSLPSHMQGLKQHAWKYCSLGCLQKSMPRKHTGRNSTPIAHNPRPPASNPPASSPPASNPPASSPPASSPPASNPPASIPPVSNPIPAAPPQTSSGGFWSALGAAVPRIALSVLSNFVGTTPILGPVVTGLLKASELV